MGYRRLVYDGLWGTSDFQLPRHTIMLYIEDFVRTGCRLGYVPEVYCPRVPLPSRGGECALDLMVSTNGAVFDPSVIFKHLFTNQKPGLVEGRVGERMEEIVFSQG